MSLPEWGELRTEKSQFSDDYLGVTQSIVSLVHFHFIGLVWFIVFNAAFNNISVILWWSVTVFTVFRLLTDFVCLYNYEFWLSLCKIVRSSVILLLPLFIGGGNRSTRRKPRSIASHWQILSHNVVLSTPHHERGSNSQL
jgi:uncharacterized membrane protein YfhO